MLRLFKRLFVGRTPRARPGSDARRAEETRPIQEGAPAASAVPLLFASPLASPLGEADQALVRRALERLRQELSSGELALPPFPVIALRIAVFLKKGDADSNELVRMIGQDPSITAKVLQAANSALYSPTRAVDTIRAAVMSMGTKAVSTLVLGEATRSMFDSGARAMPDSYRHHSARVFHDSATASHGAGALAIAVNRGRIDRVFLGGMLHDIGKPLALRTLAALENRPADLDLIDAVVECVHVAAGRLLLQRWELPDGLIELCARHHDDVIEPGSDGDDMHVLRVASGIVAHLRGTTPESLHAQVLHSINALKITPDHTKVLVADARDHSRVVTSSYGLDAAHAFVAPSAPTNRSSQQRPTGSRDPR